MNINNSAEIEKAIKRSIAHTEIARVPVENLDAAYGEVRIICGVANGDFGTSDCGFSVENDGAYDVYGTMENGDEFRIRLVKSE